jgi:hypothetical protein
MTDLRPIQKTPRQIRDDYRLKELYALERAGLNTWDDKYERVQIERRRVIEGMRGCR